MSDDENVIPISVVDTDDYEQVMKKLDLIDQKVEFFNSEVAQRIGKKIGRDIGILYGLTIGILIFLLYISLSSIVY
ncbi:tetrahydromethanopterin S-methyltransferase subunit MtrG [Methanosalsum natronophilum]|uniref:Tetrahydromethanopterin S-methyltransferase subunit G n=1 Tax=Methanosalsum natronophilum TaxID=768733 RepID=A0A3R7XGZ5_9EURY|nr:tetrahydromethanopterin S-methyltransferase subunit G [Methanosalsum natronophilum]MCS3923761.1 tetrahydromethanopterin S-methyltransferase subunit G [Methanosalsum natronophilum]RQD83149.1 MAG: tetrahydromethanopterin S-methyltransferase subunit G [Methanosalsum natronophilum]